MKIKSISAIVLAAAAVLAATPLRAEDAFQFPKLRVPELAAAPTMDGNITEGEYASALSFTGVAGNPLGKPFLLAEKQQVTWFLGFKGDMLYIAMRSPHAKGTYPAGRAKGDDNPDVLWGDHTEIQILTNKREDANKPGMNSGFYKIMHNALGTQWDFHWLNGTPGTEDLWTTGGETKSRVTEEFWELELSVKASAVKLKQWDGSTFVLQLVRADSPFGMYYAGLVGESWMSWKRFAEAVCDAKAPAFHLESLGEPMEGRLDVKTSALAGAGEPQKINVSVSVQNADGTQLLDKKETITAQAGAKAAVALQKDGLAVSDVTFESGRNWLEITAAWQDGKEEKILFHNRMPFMKMTPEWRAKYLDAWLAAKAVAGQWDATFAYLPYSGNALAKVDLDFFGVPEEAKKATRFSVEVRKQGDSAKIATGEAALKSGAGDVLVNLPDLADGDYEAVFKLDSGPSQTVGFQRKHYPFERNTLGMSNEVVPPYLPIVVNPDKPVIYGGGASPKTAIEKPKGDLVLVWGRGYEFGANGLPARIQAAPPTGASGGIEDVLATPIRLEATVGGKSVAVEGTGSRITEALPHKAVVASEGKAGALGVSLSSTVEYDGWIEVALTLKPEGEIALDALDLLVDVRNFEGDAKRLPSPADTLLVQRMGAGVDNSYHGEIQAKPGIAFESSQIGAMTARTGPCDIQKDWKTFVPICYLGGADRGLWFFAWSDKGWTLKDGQSALTVERLKDGNARLRVRLIAGPEKIVKERTLKFALQASPIKANDPEYRKYRPIAHDTSGYRYYGDSVDSYVLPSDEDYKKLREYLVYGISRQKDPDTRYRQWADRQGAMISAGRADRIMLYGSQWMTGAGSPEFDTYGGEWLGNNDWKPVPETKYTGNKNYGGTIQWNTPKQLSPFRVNWPQSMLDFFVFYHDRLIDKAGINGTWWDNCYGGVVTEYDPELGRLDSVWNLYPRRQLCKRLNVIGWEHMRPPCWSMNTEVEMAWCQVYWLCEGFWGPVAQDISVMEHYAKADVYANNTGLGFFRAAVRPKSNSMAVNSWYIGWYGGLSAGTTPEKDRAIKRGVDGLLLTHDVRAKNDKELMRKLQYLTDYDNSAECLFMGYWRSAPFVQLASKEVVASIYQNPTRKIAAVVFFNQGNNDLPLGGTLLAPAGIIGGTSGSAADAAKPMELKRCYDLETGEEIKLAWRDGRLAVDEPLVVTGQGMRVIALEAEE